MVLYLAREYKSAGVVSRIATTRKKVEGIKRCSLLFDRERRRFLFAKRAFSRFDNFASFGSLFILIKKMLLRYFSFFVLRSKYHFYHIRPVSFGLVVEKRGTKKILWQRTPKNAEKGQGVDPKEVCPIFSKYTEETCWAAHF